MTRHNLLQDILATTRTCDQSNLLVEVIFSERLCVILALIPPIDPYSSNNVSEARYV